MAHTTVALDALQTLEGKSEFTAKIALDDIFPLLDCMHNLGQLLFVQVLRADARVDRGVSQDHLGVHRADSVNITERDIDSLLAWDVYTYNACHKFFKLTLTLLVARVRTNDTNHTFATHHFAVFAQFLH